MISKRITKYSGFIFLLIISLTITVITLSFSKNGDALQKWFDYLHLPLMLGRFSLYGILFFRWQKIINYFSVKQHWTEEKTNHALNERNRTFCWIIILELLIGQNLFGKLALLF